MPLLVDPILFLYGEPRTRFTVYVEMWEDEAGPTPNDVKQALHREINDCFKRGELGRSKITPGEP